MKRFLLSCAALSLVAATFPASAKTLALTPGLYIITATATSDSGSGCSGTVTVGQTTVSELTLPASGGTTLEIDIPAIAGPGTVQVESGFTPALGTTGLNGTYTGSGTLYGAGPNPIPLGPTTATFTTNVADRNTGYGTETASFTTANGPCNVSLSDELTRSGK